MSLLTPPARTSAPLAVTTAASPASDAVADAPDAVVPASEGAWQAAARWQMWELIVENANDPVVVTTTELSCPGPQIVYVNAAFSRMTGYDAGEVIGQTPRILQGALTDRAEMERMRLELQAGRPFVGETINYTKAGQPYWMEWSVYGLRDQSGALTHYVAVQRDISARKRYEAQIEAQARLLEAANAQLALANARLATLSLTDSLTGVANHRALHQRLDEEIERAARYGTPLSLLLVDVDRFKTYNDEFGHPAGDVALQNIARLLQQHGRGSDMVARHGGEEFAVLLPQTDRAGALALAEELRAVIESETWPLRPVTVSIGVATREPSPFGVPPEAPPATGSNWLMNQADQALYQSKTRGRNQVT